MWPPEKVFKYRRIFRKQLAALAAYLLGEDLYDLARPLDG